MVAAQVKYKLSLKTLRHLSALVLIFAIQSLALPIAPCAMDHAPSQAAVTHSETVTETATETMTMTDHSNHSMPAASPDNDCCDGNACQMASCYSPVIATTELRFSRTVQSVAIAERADNAHLSPFRASLLRPPIAS